MGQFDSLHQHFESFQRLGVGAPERKNTIREFQQAVKAGQLALSVQDSAEYRRSNLDLARILCYLIEQFGNTAFNRARLREGIDEELIRRRRDAWSPQLSNQPLYYAIRAYVERCLEETKRFEEAQSDRTVFEEVLREIEQHPHLADEVDIRDQVRRFMDNMALLEKKSLLEAMTGPAAAAKIAADTTREATKTNKWTTKFTVIVGAVVAVLVALVGLVSNNLAPLLSRPSAGASSPAQTMYKDLPGNQSPARSEPTLPRQPTPAAPAAGP